MYDKAQDALDGFFGSTYDPALFLSGEYAVDRATVATLVLSGMRYWRYLVGA